MPATKAHPTSPLGALYRARPQPALVEVPEMGFLMIDGQGDPNDGGAFQDAVQALYAIAYTTKFAVRRSGGVDFRVMPLEGLWWTDAESPAAVGERFGWSWTLMIMQPDQVTPELIASARDAAAARRPLDPLARVRYERFEEGRCAQILHIGPYSAEGATIERLHAFIADAGLRPRGRHHEIYLGDPRRAAPARLRTILRQPVEEA